MEVSGLGFSQVQSSSGDYSKTHFSKPLCSCRSINFRSLSSGNPRFGGCRISSSLNVSSSGFSDDGHLQYYVSPRCGGKKKEKEKVVVKEKQASAKKKLKLIQGLMKNLSMYSEMGFPEIDVVSVGIEQGKTISETTEVLLAQLEKLKVEEKEMKRKKKDEKAKMKALKMKSKGNCESSSSSSSSSSDSECGEVIDMRSLRGSTLVQPKVDTTTHEQAETASTSSTSLLELQEEEQIKMALLRSGQECCSSTSSVNGGGMSSVTVEARSDRIDVCMGGKCKKLGAPALLEELKAKVGMEGAVVGCKCMGKCRSAPNVRVSNQSSVIGEGGDSSIRVAPSNPLYIGVGLDDVSAIVANFFGEEMKSDLGLMATAA